MKQTRQPVKCRVYVVAECRIFSVGEFVQLSIRLKHLTHSGGENPGVAVPCAAGAWHVTFSPAAALCPRLPAEEG